jgi:hypothetical protein
MAQIYRRNFQITQKDEVRPKQNLFSLPQRIHIRAAKPEDRQLDERLVRILGNYQESTQFHQKPREVLQRVSTQNRQPKRKLEEVTAPTQRTETKFSTTKPESYRFNEQSSRQQQTSFNSQKEPNAFQRRLMSQNSIRSSIQKCNQVKSQSTVEPAVKRFKDNESEKLMAKIEEFYRIPELLDSIDELPRKELDPKIEEFYRIPQLVQPLNEFPEKAVMARIEDFYKLPELVGRIDKTPAKRMEIDSEIENFYKVPKAVKPLGEVPRKVYKKRTGRV